MTDIKIGSLITFSYPAVHKEGTKAHDRFPRVLVLHPSWRKPSEAGGVPLLHGLNFNYLSDDEINTVRMIIDPFYEMQYRDAMKRKNPNLYADLERLISSPGKGLGGTWGQQATAARNVRITSPQQFYQGIVRPWIRPRQWDPYRRYRPDKMRNIRVVTKAAVMTGEESLKKWQQEREKLSKAVGQALTQAKTDADKRQAAQLQKDLDKATNMSQRRSILSKVSDFLKHKVGPRFGGFRR